MTPSGGAKIPINGDDPVAGSDGSGMALPPRPPGGAQAAAACTRGLKDARRWASAGNGYFPLCGIAYFRVRRQALPERQRAGAQRTAA